MNKFMKRLVVSLFVFLPIIAQAQYLTNTEGILGAASGILEGILIPIAFTLSLLYFFWGVAKYIKSEGDGKAEGKQIMIWGVVAIFVISSIWALVFFISSELGVQSYDPGPNGIQIPQIGK